MVKDDFWTDTELIKNLPPIGRMFYQGLWQLAEETGVVEDDTMAYKMQLFPGDSDISLEDIEKWVTKLKELGKLIQFENNGSTYFYIKNFHRHQSFSHPPEPNLPLPPWVDYIPNPESRRAGAYAIDYSQIDDSYEAEIKYIGKPYKKNGSSTNDTHESRKTPTGDEKEYESEVEGEKEKEKEQESEKEQSSASMEQIREIVNYLNEKADRKFKPTSDKTKDKIRARFNNNFDIDDFKNVIDTKVADWKGDDEMEKYLRPRTLFSNKFEDYLNQPMPDKKNQNDSKDTYDIMTEEDFLKRGAEAKFSTGNYNKLTEEEINILSEKQQEKVKEALNE